MARKFLQDYVRLFTVLMFKLVGASLLSILSDVTGKSYFGASEYVNKFWR